MWGETKGGRKTLEPQEDPGEEGGLIKEAAGGGAHIGRQECGAGGCLGTDVQETLKVLPRVGDRVDGTEKPVVFSNSRTGH